MDYLRSRMEWKDAESGEQGIFTGHAAVFGNRDLGGDVIEPGAMPTRTSNSSTRTACRWS